MISGRLLALTLLVSGFLLLGIEHNRSVAWAQEDKDPPPRRPISNTRTKKAKAIKRAMSKLKREGKSRPGKPAESTKSKSEVSEKPGPVTVHEGVEYQFLGLEMDNNDRYGKLRIAVTAKRAKAKVWEEMRTMPNYEPAPGETARRLNPTKLVVVAPVNLVNADGQVHRVTVPNNASKYGRLFELPVGKQIELIFEVGSVPRTFKTLKTIEVDLRPKNFVPTGHENPVILNGTFKVRHP